MVELDLQRYVRDIVDFPKPGIVFKDITPLLAEPAAFAHAVHGLAERVVDYRPDGIVAIESRGFIFGAALATRLSLPLHLIRKPGKLPSRTISVSYELEYGTGELQLHSDSVRAGERCAIIDDLIATGGTAAATARLVQQLGGEPACFAFLIELGFLGGRRKLTMAPVETLIRYDE